MHQHLYARMHVLDHNQKLSKHTSAACQHVCTPAALQNVCIYKISLSFSLFHAMMMMMMIIIIMMMMMVLMVLMMMMMTTTLLVQLRRMCTMQ